MRSSHIQIAGIAGSHRILNCAPRQKTATFIWAIEVGQICSCSVAVKWGTKPVIWTHKQCLIRSGTNKDGRVANMQGLILTLLIMLPTSTAAGLFGPEAITGFCMSDRSHFNELIRSNNYRLRQTSAARDGRSVILYTAGAEFMVAVADEDRSRWCVQFTSENLDEFIRFLVGRYDPTTRGDEGTD